MSAAEPSADEPSPWWAVALVVIGSGVLAGAAGAGLTELLHAVQALAYGGRHGTFLDTVATSPPVRRVVAPVVGGLLAGLAWWWLGRLASGHSFLEVVPVSRAARDGTSPRLRIRGQLLDAVVQICVVAAGASLGREGAPRQVAATLADWLSSLARIEPRWRSHLVAAAAGSGLAAVYNVPVAGVAYAMEVVALRWSWRGLVVAVPMSALATVVAWPVVGMAPVYSVPRLHVGGWLLLALVPAVAVWTALGLCFGALMRACSRHIPTRGVHLVPAIAAAGLAVGIVSLWLPEVAGNGKGVVQVTLEAVPPGLWFLVALMVCKALMTGAYLGAGARGGLLTPAMAVGAAAGAVMARATPGLAGVALLSILAAGAVLAVGQDAPLFAGLFLWELCHPGWGVGLLTVACCAATWATARLVRRWTTGLARLARPALQREGHLG